MYCPEYMTRPVEGRSFRVLRWPMMDANASHTALRVWRDRMLEAVDSSFSMRRTDSHKSLPACNSKDTREVFPSHERTAERCKMDCIC